MSNIGFDKLIVTKVKVTGGHSNLITFSDTLWSFPEKFWKQENKC